MSSDLLKVEAKFVNEACPKTDLVSSCSYEIGFVDNHYLKAKSKKKLDRSLKRHKKGCERGANILSDKGAVKQKGSFQVY